MDKKGIMDIPYIGFGNDTLFVLNVVIDGWMKMMLKR